MVLAKSFLAPSSLIKIIASSWLGSWWVEHQLLDARFLRDKAGHLRGGVSESLRAHRARILLLGILGIVNQDVRSLGELDQAPVAVHIALNVGGVNDGLSAVLKLINQGPALRVVIGAGTGSQ